MRLRLLDPRLEDPPPNPPPKPPELRDAPPERASLAVAWRGWSLPEELLARALEFADASLHVEPGDAARHLSSC